MPDQLGYSPPDLVWLSRYLQPREAHHAIARECQPLVAITVLLECTPVAVEPMAVHLDDQPLLPPHEIDLHRTAIEHDPLIDLRRFDTDRHADRQDQLLQLALGESRAFLVFVEDLPQPRRPTPAGGTLEHVIQCIEIEDAHDLCLSDRALELLPVENICEIEECARDGRAGDSAYACDVRSGEGADPMDRDSLA